MPFKLENIGSQTPSITPETKVSVIIPCFNAELFIAETIQSVINQDFQDWELLIINDGSTDNSEAIIKGFRDDRIHYYYKKNSGVSDTRNFGIERSRGAYIAFLDADDLFLPPNLFHKVSFLDKNSIYGFVHSQEIRFGDFFEETITQGLEGDVLNLLLEMKAVIHSPSSVVVRKQLLEKIGGFDTNLSTSADWDLWVRLAKISKLGFINTPLVKYRLHNNQMHSNIPLMEKDMLYAMEKARDARAFKGYLHQKFCLSNLYLILAACYRKDYINHFKFFKYLLKSITTHPKPLLSRLYKRVFGKV